MTDDSWELISSAYQSGTYDTDISPGTVRSRFDLYLQLIDRWNSVSGLTTVHGETDRVIKHFVDSLALLPLLNPPAGMPGEHTGAGRWMADVGTGAGFPAIPCAIVRPDLSWWLVDKDSLKRRFLTTTTEALGISAAVASSLSDCFVADAARAPTFRVARALAAPLRALELCAPSRLPAPDSVILMLGPSAESEIPQISLAAEQRDLRLQGCIRYDLPRGAGGRLILSFTRFGSSQGRV